MKVRGIELLNFKIYGKIHDKYKRILNRVKRKGDIKRIEREFKVKGIEREFNSLSTLGGVVWSDGKHYIILDPVHRDGYGLGYIVSIKKN